MKFQNAFISTCFLAVLFAVTSSKAQNIVDYKLLEIKKSPTFTEWSAIYNRQPLKKGYYKTDTATAQNDVISFYINDNGNLTDSMKTYQFGRLSATATFDDGYLQEYKLYRMNGSLRQKIVPEKDAYRRYLYDDNEFLYEERLEAGKRKTVYKKRRKADGITEIETDYLNNVERVLENGEVIAEYRINTGNNEKEPLILDHRKE